MKLERQTRAVTRSWVRHHVAGLACCGLGLLAIGLAAWLHLGGGGSLTEIPDVRITMPFLVLALGAGIAAFVRREGAYVLPVSGMGLAAAAMVLGWALVLAVVVGITLIAILILSEMM